ncbi:leucyl/phenylalanyl-tRNA--protein transferase [Terrihabitans sp. B22-R8]|uniref:leucyl/phenylalanyl-tRNA--protein transferase n=1 Tax=Terrihabitans sp. B22-R8 TaxID=3425128 RepID=UPI00403C1CAB
MREGPRPDFRESGSAWARRVVLGFAYALKPSRIADIPGLLQISSTGLLRPGSALPDPHHALRRPEGLCGLAHDLSVPTLVEAYARGLYPFSHVGPQKWWSPSQRCVLFFEDTHIAKRLRAHLRQARFRVTFDEAFDRVMIACAQPDTRRVPLTWITPAIMRAFSSLHRAGHAHSFEVWDSEGALVGGGYGVASGGVFVVESRFARVSNTSKFGFMVLNWHLQQWGFSLVDNKRVHPNVVDMGFRDIPRADYLNLLQTSPQPKVPAGRWTASAGMADIADWQPAANTNRF